MINVPKLTSNSNCNVEDTKGLICVREGKFQWGSTPRCVQYLGGPLMKFDEAKKLHFLIGMGSQSTNHGCHDSNSNGSRVINIPHASVLSSRHMLMKNLEKCQCPHCEINSNIMLTCNYDSLATFPEGLFALCPHIINQAIGLLFITLNRQRITELNMDTLFSLPRMELLDLSSNAITHVSNPFINPPLDNLKTLNLSQNSLDTISEGALDTFTALKLIDLRSNPINEYTTYSWSFCYTRTLKLKPYPFLGNIQVYKYYGHNHSHLHEIEESFCDTLTDDYQDYEKEPSNLVEECHRSKTINDTLNCTSLDYSSESINALACFTRKTESTFKQIQIQFPKDATSLHYLDNLSKCAPLDKSNNETVKKYHRIQSVLVIHAISFDLETIFDHINSNFTQHVTIRADIVILNKPITIPFHLTIRARKCILLHPITMTLHLDLFHQLTNHLHIERHIRLKDDLTARHRKYALVDIVDQLPDNHDVQDHKSFCLPKIYELNEVSDDQDWYDGMNTNMMYICAHTLMTAKEHHLAKDIATWQYAFNAKGHVTAFATPKKFESIIFYVNYPTLNRIPSSSMANILDMATVMYRIFHDYADNERLQDLKLAGIQNTMTMVFTQLDSDKQNTENIFKAEENQLKAVFHSAEMTQELLFSAIQKNRKTILESVEKTRVDIGSAIQNSTKFINDKIQDVGLAITGSLVEMTEYTQSHFANQADVLKKKVKNHSHRLGYSKNRINYLHGELKKRNAELNTTVENLEKELEVEVAIQASKAAAQFTMAILTFGLAGDPNDAAKTVEKVGKIIKFILELAQIILDLTTNLIGSTSFQAPNTDFIDSMNDTVPEDFLASVDRAYKWKNTELKFDAVLSEGHAIVDDLRKNTDYVDTKALKVAIDGLVNTGKALVQETQTYSGYLLNTISAQDSLHAAEKDVVKGSETVQKLNNRVQSMKEDFKDPNITIGEAQDYYALIDTLTSEKAKMTDFPVGGKDDFLTKLFDSLEKYKIGHKKREASARSKFNSVIEALNRRAHEVQMESITKKLMLIELFNDFCAAKLFMTFEKCIETSVPNFEDTYPDIQRKINDMNLESLSSTIMTKQQPLIQTLFLKQASMNGNDNPLEMLKLTNSTSVNLMHYMRPSTLRKYSRIRITSVLVVLTDSNGFPVFSKDKIVRFGIGFPIKFTDTDESGRQYQFVTERHACISEYEKRVTCKCLL